MANRQVIYARRPEGVPVEADFELRDSQVPTAGPGLLHVRNLWLSLAPYQRLAMAGRYPFTPGFGVGHVMPGETVSRVVASGDPGFAPGELVLCRGGWQTEAAVPATDAETLPAGGPDPRLWLGALGINGLTAFAGLIDTGRPRPGDTVVVSAAAGSVGGLVGQIARIAGCRAVGIAGGPEKCRLATGTFGFDACVDYKAEGWTEALKAACPDGIDVYFDNVGGSVLDAAIPLLAIGGRIVLCGSASQYNAATPYPSPPLGLFVGRRAEVRGFVVYDHMARRDDIRRRLSRWLADGRLRNLEDVAEGLDAAPGQFCRLMRGETMGKVLVRLDS